MQVLLLITIILIGALNVAGLLYRSSISFVLIASASIIPVAFVIGCLIEVAA